MSKDIFAFFINIPVIFTAFLLGFILPNILGDDTLFGLKVPPNEKNNPEIIFLIKEYRKKYTALCGSYIFIFTILFYYISKYYILIPGLAVYTLLMDSCWHSMVKKARKLNWIKGLNIAENNCVIIDTTTSKPIESKKLISPGWFLLPITIIIITIVVGIIIYPNYPVFVPYTHFSFSAPIHWIRKRPMLVLLIPSIEVLIVIMIFAIYTLISKIQPEEHNVNIEISKEKNSFICTLWSCFLVTVCTLLNIILLLAQLNLFDIINLKLMWIITSVILCIVAAFAIFIVIIAKNSSKYMSIVKNRVSKHKTPCTNVIDRSDDAYWKLGSFYYNPQDPAIWIRKVSYKRLNINYGKPVAWIIVSIPVTIFIVLIVFLRVFNI